MVIAPISSSSLSIGTASSRPIATEVDSGGHERIALDVGPRRLEVGDMLDPLGDGDTTQAARPAAVETRPARLRASTNAAGAL